MSYADPFGLSPTDGRFRAPLWVHGLFGLLGSIPGIIGTVANLADGVLYLLEGDYLGAAISFLDGFTMGVTSLATKAIEAGKFCRVAATAVKAARVADRVSGAFSFIQNGYNIAKTGVQMWNEYAVQHKSLGWNTVSEVANIALSVMGGINGASRALGHNDALALLQRQAEAGALCFVAGTLICTADGYKAIEDIEVEDEVYSSDVETGEVALKPVEQVFVNETNELVHLTVEGKEIVTTPTHPFYAPHKGWTAAVDLRAGDILVTVNGEYVVLEQVQHEILEAPVKVYNFEVADYHTYYVSESNVLVHNKCGQQTATDKRNSAGTVTGGEDLPDVERMMRGSHGNAGVIPQEIANRMRGKQYSSFDEFRDDFWRTVADSSYASEFSSSNIARMRGRNAPKVVETQSYGGLSSYILHHITPIHAGGEVYDLDNLMIVTPQLHQVILDSIFHFGH